MISYKPLALGTLLVPSGPSHDPGKKHSYVICTDPCDKGLQVIVPICKRTNHLCDTTCNVQPHEHEFLDVLSFVMYRKADIKEAQFLIDGVTKKLLIPKKNINAQSFLRIKNGICKSKETPRKVKRYLECPQPETAANSPSTGAKPDARNN